MALMAPNPASVRIAAAVAAATAESLAKMLTEQERAIVIALPGHGGLVGYEALPAPAAAGFRAIAASGFHLSLLQHLIVVMPFGLNALGRRVREVLTGVVDIPLIPLDRP